jgi:hypothetical protein
VAQEITPLAIRPHSDFEHRSDPHRVNGRASSTLDPAGDIVAAYWLGRLLARGGGTTNVSSSARAALPWTPPADAGVHPDAAAPVDAGVDAGPAGASDGGCHCRAGVGHTPPSWLLLLGALVAMKRRRVATSKPS